MALSAGRRPIPRLKKVIHSGIFAACLLLAFMTLPQRSIADWGFPPDSPLG